MSRSRPDTHRGPARALALALLLALLPPVACSESGTELHEFDRPNVLLITLDTLRADRLGAYGYDARDASPHLDALARDAVVFERSFANSSFTPPSHASILTGLFPSEHGLTHWSEQLADVPTAAELFARAGYRTLAATPLKTLFALGLGRGFQTQHTFPVRMEPGRLLISDAETINAAVLPELTESSDQPFFAWLHYYDAHRPYGRQGTQWAMRFAQTDPVAGHTTRVDPSVGLTENYYQLRARKRGDKLGQDQLSPAESRFISDRYDGGLAYLDEQIGRLLDALEEAGVLDNTLLILTADHGEVFAEHDEEWFSHDPYLFEENLRVPLFLRLPGGRLAGTRVPDLVQGVDVLPTLLELTGVPSDGFRGSGLSLAATLNGARLERSAVFAERSGRDRTGEADVDEAVAKSTRDTRRSLRTAEHKLIHYVDQGRFELYSVDDEHTDLFGRQDDLSQRATALYLRQVRRLRATGERDAGSGELDDETLQFLRGLGYLGDEEPDDEGPGR